MRINFVIYKEDSNEPIKVNAHSNMDLLQRCQDHWSHKLDIKYPIKEKWYDKLGAKYLQGKKSKLEYLFIHIPKTGGTSFKFNVIYSPHMNKKVGIRPLQGVFCFGFAFLFINS